MGLWFGGGLGLQLRSDSTHTQPPNTPLCAFVQHEELRKTAQAHVQTPQNGFS